MSSNTSGKRKTGEAFENSNCIKRQRTNSEGHFEALPREIIVYLCKRFLSHQDAFMLSTVSKHFSFLQYHNVLWNIVEHKKDEQKSKDYFEWIKNATKILKRHQKPKRIPTFRYNKLASLLANRWAHGIPRSSSAVTFEPQSESIVAQKSKTLSPKQVYANENYIVFESVNIKYMILACSQKNEMIATSKVKEWKGLSKNYTSRSITHQVWKLDIDDVNFYTCNGKMSQSAYPKPLLVCNHQLAQSEFEEFGVNTKSQPDSSLSQWILYESAISPSKSLKQIILKHNTTYNAEFDLCDDSNEDNTKKIDLERLIDGHVVRVEMVANFMVCQILRATSEQEDAELLTIFDINNPPAGPEEVESFGELPALSNKTARDMVVGLKRILRFDRNDLRCVHIDSFL